MQAARDIGGRNNNAVGLSALGGVSLKDLAFFPEFLPLSFSGGGVVLAGQAGCGCGHTGDFERSVKLCHIGWNSFLKILNSNFGRLSSRHFSLYLFAMF